MNDWLIKSKRETSEKDFDKPLIAILETINEEDQKYRLQLDEVEKKHGRKSDEIKALWKIIQKIS